MTDEGADPPPRRVPRWGLRTLGFLVLGFVAVITAQAMGHHTVGTLGSLIFALGGAIYCSANGISAARERGFAGFLPGRGPRR
jgi:hypothetical protein